MNVKTKVLHIGCAYYPYLGGSTQRLAALMNACSKSENYEFYLITKTESNNCLEDDKYFKKIYRNIDTDKIGFNRSLFNIIKEVAPDIVVLHNSRILLSWKVFYGTFFKDIRVVNEIHSFRDDTKTKRFLNKFLYKNVDMNVVLSESAKSYLLSEYDCDKSEVIFNGVRTVNQTKNQFKKYDSHSVSYSYIGTFHKWQGVILLADAIKNLDDDFFKSHTINIVGDGPCFDEFTRLVEGKPINIYGWMPKNMADEVLLSSDYILAPRLSTTGTETVVPLKVFESIEMNRPIICTPVGGLKEVFMPKKESAIFTRDISAESLADVLKNPLTNDEYRAMAESLEELKKSVPTWEKSASRYLEVFDRI
ncbi:glycosyltransferase family 4 protein [Photobacterium ganghwense]|uniref:glycosyltransferase family 4 protein n=1 Tax=Photobacterium ganghwense TaxID=320778 RepID=UPI0039EEC5BB